MPNLKVSINYLNLGPRRAAQLRTELSKLSSSNRAGGFEGGGHPLNGYAPTIVPGTLPARQRSAFK
jgi:hypothetical protein